MFPVLVMHVPLLLTVTVDDDYFYTDETSSFPSRYECTLLVMGFHGANYVYHSSPLRIFSYYYEESKRWERRYFGCGVEGCASLFCTQEGKQAEGSRRDISTPTRVEQQTYNGSISKFQRGTTN